MEASCCRAITAIKCCSYLYKTAIRPRRPEDKINFENIFHGATFASVKTLVKTALLFILIACSQFLGYAATFTHTYAGKKHRITSTQEENAASLCSDADLSSDLEESLDQG